MPSSRLTYYANQGKIDNGDKWICGECEKEDTENKSVIIPDPNELPSEKGGYTINDVMLKLINIEQKMEEQYEGLLHKYDRQVATNEKLKKEIDEIKYKLGTKINRNEQIPLTKNIIIKGVTKGDEKENLTMIVSTVAQKLCVPIENNTIVACYRLGKTKTGEKTPIKVVFNNEQIKQKIIKAQKKKERKIEDLGLNLNENSNFASIMN
ncbi:hypothetical protein HHI36_013255 [Cryptolaemus montrouzieri]|uniref:Uncharacterized protein n=1 Tax=Cryptolaemus montrouzieri TaxID=559131 RepID=A0ABD2NH39_9CUCU